MAILIVADVHANLTALEAVIAHAEAIDRIEAIWSLGDVVGYGPQPCECISLLRGYPHLAVVGNHDLAAAGLIYTDEFKSAAAQAAAWTSAQLSEAERAYITALPLTVSEGDFTLVHGSLWDPVWGYLVSDAGARLHLRQQTTPFGLVGHSHLPLAFLGEGGRGRALGDGETLPLSGGAWVANPGGLGQPRDGDPRTAYALIDLEQKSVTFHRVPYDIGRTQAKMRAAGLPASLIERLAHGR